jgi:hypothetical protein
VQRLERREARDRRVAGDQQRSRRRLRDERERVRRDHQPVPRQPVGPDAARDVEEDHRHEPGEQDEAEVAGRAGQVQDGERQRDADQSVSHHRDRVRRVERAKALAAERPEPCSPEPAAHRP